MYLLIWFIYGGFENIEESVSETVPDQLQHSDPFEAWESALAPDGQGKLEESKSKFAQTAKLFFDLGSGTNSDVGKAFFEYSTLMDAFAGVQGARKLRRESDFEKSLIEFSRVAEILRATIHFGFLAGYLSGCAVLEEALYIQSPDEVFETLKKAIALFEQSKLALGFRDEKHPLVTVIDSLLKYSISEALRAESRMKSLSSHESLDKLQQSRSVFNEHERLAMKAGIGIRSIPYFPLEDWKRAKFTGYIVSFPENDSIWLGNIGCNSVVVETLGSKTINVIIESDHSFSYPMDPLAKGRIRVVYLDLKEKKRYDEGCLLMI